MSVFFRLTDREKTTPRDFPGRLRDPLTALIDPAECTIAHRALADPSTDTS